MTKIQSQLIDLLNSIEPRQLQMLRIPEVFKPSIRPKDANERIEYKKVDREDLKVIQQTLDIKAKQDFEEKWALQREGEKIEQEQRRRAQRIRFC